MPPQGPSIHAFYFVQHIDVHVCLQRKISFMQTIAHILGLEGLNKALASPYPIILPLIHYPRPFDVYVFLKT